MLRIICSENADQAKCYYTSSLKQEGNPLGKYYTQEQEIIGQWQGQGAKLLGLGGRVDQKAFESLCDNQHPVTKRRLTARLNDHRRVGYDFNFNCPKSVSVVQALTGDERITAVFQEAVTETMQQIEAAVQTRVRVQGAQEDRKTGNLIWGEFIHFTARPVEGKPDPHLHAHCYAFNATFDAVENKWKAGQFGTIKRDASYYEAAFHARLAHKIAELGYGVGRSGEWWEIQGVSKEILIKFSQRTERIERAAKENDLHDAKQKEKLAALTREKKIKTDLGNLKQEWQERLTPEEKQSLSHLFGQKNEAHVTVKAAMDYALSHSFERASIVTEKELMTEALWHGMGQVHPAQMETQWQREDILSENHNGQRWCTTHEVLQEEWANIDFVKKGFNQCRALNTKPYLFQNGQLGSDQKNAVSHVIRSTDQVMAIRGPAGTGKTTMMKEAVAAIEAGGTKVFTFAPSAEASRGVLRQEGFAEAQTVAHLLQNKQLHPQLRGQALWIDEAGLLSARQMHGIFQLTEKENCRVILSGDTRQHTAVERGDALRLLETHAGLISAQLTEIRRQKHSEYRDAVKDFALGHSSAGFTKLDACGFIQELPEKHRYQKLAQDYVDVPKIKTALVISPTHAEAEKVSAAIRAALQQKGNLSTKEQIVPRLINLQKTEAERSQAHTYQTGQVVQFQQNTPDFTRGEKVVVTNVAESTVSVRTAHGQEKVLPLNLSSRFQIYQEAPLPLAPGEHIRITQNGFTADGKHRLNNGAVYQIKGFTQAGDLRLTSGWVISKDYGNLSHGYCHTSHVAQSKTVDRVFIAQSSASLGASSAEQFYVSISRARESVTVYTDDKAQLQEAIQSSSLRLSAHELLKLSSAERQTMLFEDLRKKHNQKLTLEAGLSTEFVTAPVVKNSDVQSQKPKLDFKVSETAKVRISFL